MSDKSKIEWTEATWNPITGCSKISQGCKHCYAEREWPRLAAPRAKPNLYTGREFTDVRCHPEKLDIPLRWQKPRRIFVNSMSDLFHENVPESFIYDVFDIIERAPRHIFQILTKRPQRMADVLARISGMRRCRNLWLGVSIENQVTADERIPLLLQTPAVVRWISAEPLLGPIDLTWIDHHAESLSHIDVLRGAYFCDGLNEPRSTPKLNWIVVGGESGPRARPMHPQWVRDLRDMCRLYGTDFFFKQWGEWSPDIMLESERGDRSNSQRVSGGKLYDSVWMTRFGKKSAGRTLDGRTWDEYPA